MASYRYTEIFMNQEPILPESLIAIPRFTDRSILQNQSNTVFQQTSPEVFYQIKNTNNAIESICIKLNDFSEALSHLYSIISMTGPTHINNYVVIVFYKWLPIATFKPIYQNGLYLIDNDNRIRVASIYPQAIIYDTHLTKLFANTDKSLNSMNHKDENIRLPEMGSATNKQPKVHAPPLSNIYSIAELLTPKPTPVPNKEEITIADHPSTTSDSVHRHTKMANNEQIYNQAKKNNTLNKDIKVVPKVSRQFDEAFELKKEEVRNQKLEQFRRNEKFNTFESDKKSYLQLKKDIENGLIKSTEIHPYFILRYHIFKVLELRGAINFTNSDHILTEYNLFTDLYEAYEEDNDQDTRSASLATDTIDTTNTEPCVRCKPAKSIKPYIPHNYKYMTDSNKEAYAKKYKMSRREFEDKYASSIFADDLGLAQSMSSNEKSKTEPKIEPKTESKPDLISESRPESVLGSDSEADDDSDNETDQDTPTSRIDPAFLELMKQMI